MLFVLLTVTSEDVCRNLRNVKLKLNVILFSNMRFIVMFVTAVCVLFLIKLRWPQKKNFDDTVYMRYGQETLKIVRALKRKSYVWNI